MSTTSHGPASGGSGNDGSGRVTAVCVVHEILPDEFDDVPITAIDKRATTGTVQVEPLGLAGDTQCDTVNHGGPDKAVHVYADEDAAWWSQQLGRDIPPGLFGENLRLSGVDVTGAEIGEHWQIGDGDQALLLEVTCPRIPCRTFQARMGEPHWIRRFTEHGAPGAYLRVLRPGPVQVGMQVRIVHRLGHGVSVGAVSLRPQPESMAALLAAEDAGQLRLGVRMRETAVRVAGRDGSGSATPADSAAGSAPGSAAGWGSPPGATPAGSAAGASPGAPA